MRKLLQNTLQKSRRIIIDYQKGIQMIRLATVFSGIGAIEHALDRMSLNYEIVFACDNGDVDVLSKKIDVDIDCIDSELNDLKSLIANLNFLKEDDYDKQLQNMLNSVENEFNDIKCILDSSNMDINQMILEEILLTILGNPNLNNNRKTVYNNFVNSLKSESSSTQKKLLFYQITLKLFNDFKKDNSRDDLGKDIEFKSSLNVNWSEVSHSLSSCYSQLEDDNGKTIIGKVRNLSQRVGQLYGRINSLYHLDEINKIKDYSKKKEYVDDLYKGNERRNKVMISYMENYECSNNHFHWNATFLDGNQYKNHVDLFVGGSPCQSFSLVGKQRGLSDTRGTLFYEYARLVKEIQPKVFIYENVRAVLSNDCGRTWEKMEEVFGQLGYNVFYTKYDGSPSILNARDYGIPQNRSRLFVVGFRPDIKLDEDFEFPKPISLDKTMQDFLIDNSPLGSFLPQKRVEFVIKDQNKYDKMNDIPILEKYFISDKVKKIILAPGTKNFYSRPEIDLEIARPLLSTMHKMHRAGIDNYVTTQGRLRRLTPRECLRLMGFSDDWKIVVSDTAMYQQAGNSIVVDVLIHILDEIIKVYPALTRY